MTLWGHKGTDVLSCFSLLGCLVFVGFSFFQANKQAQPWVGADGKEEMSTTRALQLLLGETGSWFHCFTYL